jgi:5-methylcytosine-specific restriction endonuclease McrA
MAIAEPIPAPAGPAPLLEHRRRGSESGRVLVLNATYEPVNVCTVKRAVVLLLKEKAEMIEHGDRQLHSATSSMTRPMVIRLITYVRIPRDTHRRKITRRAVFARDDWTCQYCGSRQQLTVDHVVPRSKGGGSTWDNIVASCAPCNRRKADHLPRQAGMRLLKTPKTPNPDVFIQVASPTIPSAWKAYLAA